MLVALCVPQGAVLPIRQSTYANGNDHQGRIRFELVHPGTEPQARAEGRRSLSATTD